MFTSPSYGETRTAAIRNLRFNSRKKIASGTKQRRGTYVYVDKQRQTVCARPLSPTTKSRADVLRVYWIIFKAWLFRN